MSVRGRDRTVSIILNWNGAAHTTACLRSLAELTGVNHVPLVVDNGSTDGSVARLRSEFPGLWIIETGANLGFGGGINHGIATARSAGADFLWLLNNDTTVAPDALRQLIDALHGRPDRPDVIWYAGATVTPPAGHHLHRGLGEQDRGQFDRIEELECACACSLLVRSSALKDIGPLPTDYFLYWEDVAWSTMAAAAGWRILFVPRSRIWHESGASLTSEADPPQMLRLHYLTRNRILYHRRHRPSQVWRVVWDIVFNAARMTRTRRWRPMALAHWRGLRDGILGRTGRIDDRSAGHRGPASSRDTDLTGTGPGSRAQS
jgi:GT2 family glycosyltransferase